MEWDKCIQCQVFRLDDCSNVSEGPVRLLVSDITIWTDREATYDEQQWGWLCLRLPSVPCYLKTENAKWIICLNLERESKRKREKERERNEMRQIGRQRAATRGHFSMLL